MTPASELTRLFSDIPLPDPLDSIEADEAINGICVQDDDDE